MKTIEHLYDEIKKSEELKKEFASAMKENRIEDFTRAHGCNATTADVMAFLTSIKEEKLTEDDLGKVAGGCDVTNEIGCTKLCTDNCY